MHQLFEPSDPPVLRVHVQPGAPRSAVVGRHGDALKVKVAAPAESGRANAALIDLLGSVLGVPPSSLRITTGARGRRKRVAVAGIDAPTLAARLEAALGGPHGPP